MVRTPPANSAPPGALFVPTHVTNEMRAFHPVKEFYTLIQKGGLEAWTPGFYDGCIASKWVFRGRPNTLASRVSSDRDWKRLFVAHAFTLCDVIEASFVYRSIHPLLDDAQRLAQEYPRLYEWVGAKALWKLKMGDLVQVRMKRHELGRFIPGERFWVLVHGVEAKRGGRIRGMVCNTLVYYDFKAHELIEILQQNVYDVVAGTPETIENAEKMIATRGDWNVQALNNWECAA